MNSKNKPKRAAEKALKDTANLASQIQERWQDVAGTMVEGGQDALDKSREQIRKWPISMVAGAFVAGLMIDRFVWRR